VIISRLHTPIALKNYLKHWKFSNTVAAASAWTPATVSLRPVSWSSGPFGKATMSTGRQTIAAVETLMMGKFWINSQETYGFLWQNFYVKC